MSKKRETIRRTGRFTQEEKITYLLQYRFDLGERFAFVDEEAFRGESGSIFYEKKDGSFKCGGTCTSMDFLDISKLIAEGKYEKGDFVKVIECEAEYE
jgi:hypothetical protein